MELAEGFSDSPFDSLKHAQEAAQKALAIDDQHPYAFALKGGIHLTQRQYDKAIAKVKKSIALDPNYYGGHCVLEKIMHYVGRFEESIELIKKAMRLCPHYHPLLLHDLGRNYFFPLLFRNNVLLWEVKGFINIVECFVFTVHKSCVWEYFKIRGNFLHC